MTRWAISGLMHRSKWHVYSMTVGEDVKLRRDREAERVGGLAVDHEMEPRGLLDRQLGGPRALENLVHIGGGAVKEIGKVLAIAHQPAGENILAQCEHRRQTVTEREFGNSLHLPKENSILRNHDRWHALCRECSECVLDFLRA